MLELKSLLIKFKEFVYRKPKLIYTYIWDIKYIGVPHNINNSQVLKLFIDYYFFARTHNFYNIVGSICREWLF